VKYATKYACKPVPEEVYRNSDDLTEAILALKGQRMFDYLGTWRKSEAEEIPQADDWQKVATMHRLVMRAARGCQESLGWLGLVSRDRLELLMSLAPADEPLAPDEFAVDQWQTAESPDRSPAAKFLTESEEFANQYFEAMAFGVCS
jgi:hypothetical protein